eukprot:1159589-Pelagomonas_calceolata.AAC.13
MEMFWSKRREFRPQLIRQVRRTWQFGNLNSAGMKLATKGIQVSNLPVTAHIRGKHAKNRQSQASVVHLGKKYRIRKYKTNRTTGHIPLTGTLYSQPQSLGCIGIVSKADAQSALVDLFVECHNTLAVCPITTGSGRRCCGALQASRKGGQRQVAKDKGRS